MSKRKLLLADDSITIQKVVNLTFADEGFDVLTANNGDDALRQISEQRPDIVLADVNIPGPNGYEICEMVRQTDEVKDLPIVLLVGSFEPFDAERAKQIGANDFLTKPFSSIRQLVATVANFVGPVPVETPAENLLVSTDDSVAHTDTIPIIPEPPAQQSSTPPVEADEHHKDGPLVTEQQHEPRYTRDIENLYDQSFAATVEMPHGPRQADHTDLGDPSMDDEMIETVYTETEMPAAAEEPQAAAPDFIQSAPESIEPSANQPDQPPDTPPANDQDFLRDLAERQPASYLSTETDDATFFEAEPESEPEPESAGDEAMAFRADEPVPADSNGNGDHTHAAEQSEQPNEEPYFADSAAEHPHPTPWDTVAEPAPFPDQILEPIQQDELDEPNLLDLGDGEAPSVIWQEDSIHRSGTPELSDEMLDRIADRVIARLSEDRIREIAERVVPDAVEAFILKKFGRNEEK